MFLVLSVSALVSYLIFISGTVWHGLMWLRAANVAGHYRPEQKNSGLTACLMTFIDLLFFRRTFSTGKFLWIGSWLFHISFFFVALRHLRFLFPMLSDWFAVLQPASVFAGYVLPVAVLYLILFRISAKKNSYSSSFNLSFLIMFFLISLGGVMMRAFFRADVVSVKRFMTGIFGLNFQPLPDNIFFLFHFGLFLFLLPLLPTHIFAAPFVIFESNKRAAELKGIIHDA